MRSLLSTLALCLIVSEPLVLAIEIPHQSMPDYSVYRRELLSKGWQPVPSPYTCCSRPKEVVCGASGRLCSAKWKYIKTGETIEFILWGDAQGRLKVAPYIEPDGDY